MGATPQCYCTRDSNRRPAPTSPTARRALRLSCCIIRSYARALEFIPGPSSADFITLSAEIAHNTEWDSLAVVARGLSISQGRRGREAVTARARLISRPQNAENSYRASAAPHKARFWRSSVGRSAGRRALFCNQGDDADASFARAGRLCLVSLIVLGLVAAITDERPSPH